MKKLILIALLFAGCYKPFEKPFIITYKSYHSGNCNENSTYYDFQDKNGRLSSFCDTVSYSIGDTIK